MSTKTTPITVRKGERVRMDVLNDQKKEQS
jgi:hypothetical protein